MSGRLITITLLFVFLTSKMSTTSANMISTKHNAATTMAGIGRSDVRTSLGEGEESEVEVAEGECPTVIVGSLAKQQVTIL